jgi:uncharacterized repeat protein (TIGR03833 family)
MMKMMMMTNNNNNNNKNNNNSCSYCHHHHHHHRSPVLRTKARIRIRIRISSQSQSQSQSQSHQSEKSQPNSFNAVGNFRENLSIGLLVGIVLKEDQQQIDNDRTKFVYGKISDFLTNSKRHPRGIKVRLESGEIGRVQEIGGQTMNDVDVLVEEENGEEENIEEENVVESLSWSSSNIVYVRGLPKDFQEEEDGVGILKKRLLELISVSEDEDNSNNKIKDLTDSIISVTIPNRSGSFKKPAIQGFGFIECKDAGVASEVIRILDGKNFQLLNDGVVNDENTFTLSASFSVSKNKNRNGSADANNENDNNNIDEEEQKRQRQILEARKAMEADALKTLDRQKRERDRIEKELETKRQLEESARLAKEKRTIELLTKRKEAQERNRLKMQLEQERLDRIDLEARKLGDIKIDYDSWSVEIQEIKAKISALK